MTPVPRALLFDLGNVVIDIDFGRSQAAWHALAGRDASSAIPPFDFDEAYRAHEAGAIDASAYFAHLARKLELPPDEAAIREGWNALLVRDIAQTVMLIDTVRARVPCHALSNTNAAHIDAIRQRFPGLLERFGCVFTSHELRMRKPDPRLFAHVLDTLGLPAGDVLFFDDLLENVRAAHALGLQAQLVTGPHDVRQALERRGLV